MRGNSEQCDEGDKQMEDRMNSGLLLVLLDEDAQNDIAGWNEKLLSIAGLTRVSWWRNALPDRDDWIGEWRRIRDDFETLAVCEIDAPFDEIERPEGVRSILFKRAKRPSQGVLRLPTMGLCVVMISPGDATDDVDAQAMRDWGDFVHFPGIVEANIPGYGLVTPYENADRDAPRFLHLYEFPQEDAEAVFERTRPAVSHRFDSPFGDSVFEHWAQFPGMVLDYLSNFSRIDESVFTRIDSPRPAIA